MLSLSLPPPQQREGDVTAYNEIFTQRETGEPEIPPEAPWATPPQGGEPWERREHGNDTRGQRRTPRENSHRGKNEWRWEPPSTPTTST